MWQAPGRSPHDLFCSAVSALGARISSVAISSLSDDVFYAKVNLELDESSIELDCRPSDAIALAVRSEALIFAEASVLRKASVWMDDETGKPIASDELARTKSPQELFSKVDSLVKRGIRVGTEGVRAVRCGGRKFRLGLVHWPLRSLWCDLRRPGRDYRVGSVTRRVMQRRGQWPGQPAGPTSRPSRSVVPRSSA